jgi:hypothetical protein
MPASSDQPRYQFGPLERRGLILGLTTGQVATLGGAGLLSVVELRMLPAAAAAAVAVLILLSAVAATFWPVAGRPLQAWLPLLIAYALRRLRGGHRFVSEAHLRGHVVVVRENGSALEALPPEERPESMRGLSILEAQAGQEQAPVGVIKDPRRHTYVGVLRVRGRSFNLLDECGQAAAIQGWASILAGYALRSSPITRLQWIERTLPDDGQAIARHFRERAAADAPQAALRVYSQAIDEARDVGSQHECLLALRVDARRSWRQVRQAGGGNLDRGACALLLRELASLAESLEAIGVTSEAVLSPRALAEVIRSAYEPDVRPKLRVIHGAEAESGPHPRNAWPEATLERLSNFRAGKRAIHATYHVREWPRIEVGPGFLAPLMLDARAQRTISMTLEPIPAVQAERELRRAQASDASDDSLRQKGGWLTSFRQQREQDNVQRAEQELADGHASYRFTAYVTVSAADIDELEAACAEVEQAASRSHLELERLVAQQELAFAYTLPLCDGLR